MDTNLSGHRVLVLEDDYYGATDVTHALEEAGAEIVGPFPDEALAFTGLDGKAPTAAVLDINFGTGPSYELARHLLERNIPFIFLTGYDAEIVPTDLGHVPIMQKPADFKTVIKSLAGVLQKRAA